MKPEIIKRILSSLVLIPIALFFIIKGSYFFVFFILIGLFVSIYEWHYMSKKKDYEIPGIIFLILSFYCAYYFRNEFYGDYLYFIMILLICICTDIGGYIFGNFFKGPKLTKISPKKTYAGMFGGFVLSLLFAIVYFNNLTYFSASFLDEQMELKTFFIVMSISLISQVGDLTISFFKRKSKIKNTGNIIPGHGGILDRIDGMIFAFPYSFLLIKIL